MERYGFTNLLLADRDGTDLSNSGQTVIVSRRKHYLMALEGTPSISEVTISDFSNTDSIEMAVPVWQGGVITGVLLADYSLSDFRHIVQVPISGGGGNSMVIDAQGVVIISSEEKSPYHFSVWLQDDATISSEEYTRFTKGLTEEESG